MPDLSDLVTFVTRGENTEAVKEAERLVLQGVSIKNIVEDGLVEALRSLRAKCTVENFQLLEVLLASRAMIEVIDQVAAMNLQKELDQLVIKKGASGDSKLDEKAITIVIGTIEGDVHDMGKHLVATISNLSGFNVIDLGKDVSPEAFIDSAIAQKADIICVSVLMTVCLPTVNEVRLVAKDRGIDPVIVVGGAAAQQTEEGYLNADYVAFDAFDGVNYFMSIS